MESTYRDFSCKSEENDMKSCKEHRAYEVVSVIGMSSFKRLISGGVSTSGAGSSQWLASVASE